MHSWEESTRLVKHDFKLEGRGNTLTLGMEAILTSTCTLLKIAVDQSQLDRVQEGRQCDNKKSCIVRLLIWILNMLLLLYWHLRMHINFDLGIHGFNLAIHWAFTRSEVMGPVKTGQEDDNLSKTSLWYTLANTSLSNTLNYFCHFLVSLDYFYILFDMFWLVCLST